MLGCNDKITDTQQRNATTLEALKADTPASMWEQFFVERGAIEFWELLQEEEEDILNFELVDLIEPLLSIDTPNQIEQVVEGIIQYLSCYQRPLSIKSLSLIGSEGKRLTYLPSAISKLTSLEELCLIDHDIDKLPAEIVKLTRLTKLDLTSNTFIKLPLEVINMASLKEIDLASNQFTKLPASLIPKITELMSDWSENLDGNPWYNVNQLMPLNRNRLRNYLYQRMPHSLLTLCMEYIEKHPEVNNTTPIRLPKDLCQAARQNKLRAVYKSHKSKNILFFKRIGRIDVPFYLDGPLHTSQDIESILKNLEGKQVYKAL